MIKIELSAEEFELLKRYIRTTPLVLIRLKSQAILMRSKGMRVSDIGDIVSRDSDTVSKWLGAFGEWRMASIFSGHAENENAGKLRREQKEEIKNALQHPPSEYGLPRGS